MIPNGSFQQGDGGTSCYFFGKTGAKLAEAAQLTGKSEHEILTDAIDSMYEEFTSMSKLELAKQGRKWTSVDDA
jgi:hypothetical protein